MSETLSHNDEFLECEKKHIFIILMGVAGFFGAFTYTIRGGVFCNAQTANFLLFGVNLGNMQWKEALYYLIPMSGYFIGTMISEILPKEIKKIHFIRWDTLFIFIEIIVVLILGFIPEASPVQISQVTINFICSMQYNTFRQARGIPMATTFCTNHWRQAAVHTVKLFKHKEKKQQEKDRVNMHIFMIVSFIVGATVASFTSRLFAGKSILILLIPLVWVLVDLLYADLKTEKELLEKVPKGH